MLSEYKTSTLARNCPLYEMAPTIPHRTQFPDLDRQKAIHILVNRTQVYVISGLNCVLFVILMLDLKQEFVLIV